MIIIGIDMALRKTGISVFDKDYKLLDIRLFDSDPKVYNDEELLILNRTRITQFIGLHYWKDLKATSLNDDVNIIIEGLAYGSPSASVDLIDGNHWLVRTAIREFFPAAKVHIVPPKAWQKFILTKEKMAEYLKMYPVTRAKKGMKHTKEEAKLNNTNKAQIKKLAKQYVYEQIPTETRSIIEQYLAKNKLPIEGRFDISDAYFLGKHLRNINDSQG